MKRQRLPEKGFTTIELVVVAAIITILAATAVPLGLGLLQRQRLNAVALGLAGWLEQVRSASLRGNGCEVAILPGAAHSGSDVLAQINSTATPNCSVSEPFRLPQEVGGDRFSLAVNPAANFSFTPLGTKWPTTDVTITISGNGYADGMARCLRLRGMVGPLEVGPVNGGECEEGPI